MHPFIPFFTENLWKKNKYDSFFDSPLIISDWSKLESQSSFKKSHHSIEGTKEIISGIRSAKSELNIKPKLFSDIILSNKSTSIKDLINKNIEIIKQVGRVKDILKHNYEKNNVIEIIVLKEKLSLKFEDDVDISSQKSRILEKIKVLEVKISNLKKKLQNKAYLSNAPKDIVQNDKDNLKDLNIEENKLRSIVSSIN